MGAASHVWLHTHAYQMLVLTGACLHCPTLPAQATPTSLPPFAHPSLPFPAHLFCAQSACPTTRSLTCCRQLAPDVAARPSASKWWQRCRPLLWRQQPW